MKRDKCQLLKVLSPPIRCPDTRLTDYNYSGCQTSGGPSFCFYGEDNSSHIFLTVFFFRSSFFGEIVFYRYIYRMRFFCVFYCFLQVLGIPQLFADSKNHIFLIQENWSTRKLSSRKCISMRYFHEDSLGSRIGIAHRGTFPDQLIVHTTEETWKN